MVTEKTKFGIIQKNLKGEYNHISFHNEWKSVMKKDNKIATILIDEDYEILDRSVSYVGGSVHKGADTYINTETGECDIEPYEYVEHGVFKLKFKIKKK